MTTNALVPSRGEGSWTWRRIVWARGRVHVGYAQRALPEVQRRRGVWLGETAGGGVLTVDGRMVYWSSAKEARKMKQVIRWFVEPKRRRIMNQWQSAWA